MTTRHTALALLAAAGLLTGCEDGTLDDTQFNSYASLSEEYEDIAGDQAGMAFVAASALPTSGTGVYEGVINVIVQDGPAVTDVLFSAVGGLELEVDFGNGTGGMVGGAQNFYRDDGSSGGIPVDGGGRFDFANIDRAAVPGVTPSFSLAFVDGFHIDGTELSGTLSGDFRDRTPGGRPDGASGIIGGTVVGGPGTGFRGTWVTELDPDEALGADG